MLSRERLLFQAYIMSGIRYTTHTASPLFELLANSRNISPDNVLLNSNVLSGVSAIIAKSFIVD